MSGITVFECNRGMKKDLVKIQLEIPKKTLEAFKEKAKETKFTPKQIMENMLRNWIDGVEAGGGQ